MKAKPFFNVIFTRSYFCRNIAHHSCNHHNQVYLVNPRKLLLSSPENLRQSNFVRCNSSSKYESYFSAIGGETDEPPPDLTPQQISAILRANEKLITLDGLIKSIECNQLPSNSPTEDRLRVSKLLNDANSSSVMFSAVFDGHGGRFCADAVTRRLFKYIALSLSEDPLSLAQGDIDNIIEDIYICPNIDESIGLTYGNLAGEKLAEFLIHQDKLALQRYATYLQEVRPKTMEEKLSLSFIRCDEDLSDEIESGLMKGSSKILLHYYFSLAASGCCVTSILVQNDDCYIASTGDCKAVLGFREGNASCNPVIKSIDLNSEHNSDNASEVRRLIAAHPKEDRKNLVRNDRLLSHLMPFRAFGDFCYKWPIEKIKRVGLTRAFGSHIIPPNYHSPPYLIPDPEITRFSLPQKTDKTIGNRFIVIATDGLWEQFQSSRCVIKQLYRHEMTVNSKKSFSVIDKNYLKSRKNFSSSANNDLNKVSGSNPSFLGSQENVKSDIKEESSGLIVDRNRCTYLLRVALGTDPSLESHLIDPLEQVRSQHKRLTTFLTLPQHLVRNFRDDISVIVLRVG